MAVSADVGLCAPEWSRAAGRLIPTCSHWCDENNDDTGSGIVRAKCFQSAKQKLAQVLLSLC